MSLTTFGESEPSVFGTVTNFVSSFFPVAHAEEEEGEEAGEEAEEGGGEEEEEEEEDEPEDPRDEIYVACEENECHEAKHHFDECQTRVEEGKLLFEGEDCIEELYVLACFCLPIRRFSLVGLRPCLDRSATLWSIVHLGLLRLRLLTAVCSFRLTRLLLSGPLHFLLTAVRYQPIFMHRNFRSV